MSQHMQPTRKAIPQSTRPQTGITLRVRDDPNPIRLVADDTTPMKAIIVSIGLIRIHSGRPRTTREEILVNVPLSNASDSRSRADFHDDGNIS